ncbi:MAG: hypothetical protein ACLR20_04030 [Bifidobacterium longum]
MESWKTPGPILESIAAKVNGEPCVTHIGTDGAGHFVKMVHNGIEYADMQVTTGVRHSSPWTRHGRRRDRRRVRGVEHAISTYLIEITAQILHHKDAIPQAVRGRGRGSCRHEGTGTWTVQTGPNLVLL